MIGYYVPVAAVGAAVSAVGCGLLSTLSPKSTAAEWAGYQFIAGAGRGLYLQIVCLLFTSKSLSGYVYELADQCQNTDSLSSPSKATFGPAIFRSACLPSSLPKLSVQQSF